MNLFRWWKRKKSDRRVNPQFDKEDKNICPRCSGQGYSINDYHYLTVNDDYERRHSSCSRCSGIGRYHKNMDDYLT